MTRDLTADAMREVAKRLDRRAKEGDLQVSARRKRSLREVTEGLWIGNRWVEVFEPVRKRHRFTRRWREVQSVQHAASAVGGFLRQRPDRRA